MAERKRPQPDLLGGGGGFSNGTTPSASPSPSPPPYKKPLIPPPAQPRPHNPDASSILLGKLITRAWDLFTWKDRGVSGMVFVSGLLFHVLLTFGGYTGMTLVTHILLLHLITSVTYVKALELWVFWTDLDVSISRRNKKNQLNDNAKALFDNDHDRPLSPPAEVPQDLVESGIFLSVDAVLPVVEMIVDVMNLGIYYIHKAYTVQSLSYSMKVIGILFLFGIIGKFFDACTFSLIVHLASFTGPLFYHRYRAECLRVIAFIEKLFQKSTTKHKSPKVLRFKTE
jgi:hypothetical protein